jgi:heavy metal sensor kinase
MRLTLWHVAAMVVVLCVYAVVIYLVVSRRASEALDRQIEQDFSFSTAVFDRTPDGTFTWMPPFERSEDVELPWVQLWNGDASELLFQNYEAAHLAIPESRRLAADASDRITRIPAQPYAIRIRSHRDQFAGVPVVFQVGRTEAAMDQDMRRLALILIVGLPIAVALAGFGGYVLASGSLAPIESMTEQARSITAERLGERLPVHNSDDEMGRLATVFNETLGRLEESFEQMRRFTADVSHELRTPLTAIRSVGEVGLRGHRDEAAYRGIIGSMLEEADRLAGLVDRILVLSRAATAQAALSRDAIDLRQLAEDVASHLSVLAEEKRQSLVVSGDGKAEAAADRQVLRQALINLVDNAIKFTPVGGCVEMRTGMTTREASIDVIDSGPGIPAEARPHVFNRFYRADEDGDVRGSGLGLSIAKSAVEASGGRLTLEASGASGSTFRITMPRWRATRAPERRRAG